MESSKGKRGGIRKKVNTLIPALLTVIGAIVGIVLSVQAWRDRAANDKAAADLNLRAEYAKDEIAKEQLEVQQQEYLRQHEEHLADALSKREADETDKVSTMMTDLLKSDSGSEETLAILTSFATENDDHADAIVNAVIAKLQRTTSMSDVELSFRLLGKLGPRAMEALGEINRSARQRYDDLIFKPGFYPTAPPPRAH